MGRLGFFNMRAGRVPFWRLFKPSKYYYDCPFNVGLSVFHHAFKGLSFVEIETQKREPGRSIELKCSWQYLGARPIFIIINF